MTKYAQFFIFINLFFVLTEANLDIKCIAGKLQEVPISSYGYGNVYSPGYTEGKPYPNEMNCGVSLIAQEGKHIRLTFNYIDIAKNMVCLDDRLSVFEAENGTLKTVSGRYCGNVRVHDYISLKNNIVITFVTSHVGTGSGFNVTYREVSTRDICHPGEFQCRSRKCIQNRDILCNGRDDCGDGTDEEDCDFPVPVPSKCGVPDQEPFTGHSLVDRIVGGREAVRGSWPWQVDFQYDFIHPDGHFCGGSLINAQWFITAAHCMEPVHQRYLVRIHVGNHHKFKTDPYEEIRYMTDFFIYGVNKEKFVQDGKYNITHDLALGKLNAPVSFNPHVQAVCLPNLNEELKIGEKCFATGWGATRGTQSADVLKQAEHPIQNGTRCYTSYIKFERETMICAGRMEPLNGLCHGDSGGPLVCKKGERWHVYGAVSYLTDTNFIGGLCGMLNQPTVFSKISPKIEWINEIILNNS